MPNLKPTTTPQVDATRWYWVRQTSFITRVILILFGRRLNREVFFPAITLMRLNSRDFHTAHKEFDPTQQGLVGLARRLR